MSHINEMTLFVLLLLLSLSLSASLSTSRSRIGIVACHESTFLPPIHFLYSQYRRSPRFVCLQVFIIHALQFSLLIFSVELHGFDDSPEKSREHEWIVI